MAFYIIHGRPDRFRGREAVTVTFHFRPKDWLFSSNIQVGKDKEKNKSLNPQYVVDRDEDDDLFVGNDITRPR